MINDILNRKFQHLREAVFAEDANRINDCQLCINEEVGHLYLNEIDDILFEELLNLLRSSMSRDIGGWEMLIWFEQMFRLMPPERRDRTRALVTAEYKQMRNSMLVLEAAEWIGGFQDELALSSVNYWLDQWHELRIESRSNIWPAILALSEARPESQSETYSSMVQHIKDKYMDLLYSVR